MVLSWLVAPFCAETLVYQFAGPVDRQLLELRTASEAWVPADELSVQRLFREDPNRCRKFLSFLRADCFGYFLERGGHWISYGWCTQPGSGTPPHLPRWTGELGANWIFYCHTREEFRGQGHYRRLLVRLVAEAQERAKDALVLCDTLPDNFASRNAVLKTGFAPVGVLTAYRLAGPLVFGGEWRRDQRHAPEMPCPRESGRSSAPADLLAR